MLVVCPPPFAGHELGPFYAEVCAELGCELIDLDGVCTRTPIRSGAPRRGTGTQPSRPRSRSACTACSGVSRRFRSHRRISLSDTDAGGRLRLDAVARYLQDVASEDWLDAGFDHDTHVWVVRRTELDVHEPFQPEDTFDDRDVVQRRRAVRRRRGATRCAATAAGRIEAESIWIHLDHDLRPKRLDERFVAVYGDSAGGRRASTRLSLPVEAEHARAARWSFRSDRRRPPRSREQRRLLGPGRGGVGRATRRPAARRCSSIGAPIDLDEPVELAGTGDSLWLTVAGETRGRGEAPSAMTADKLRRLLIVMLAVAAVISVIANKSGSQARLGALSFAALRRDGARRSCSGAAGPVQSVC